MLNINVSIFKNKFCIQGLSIIVHFHKKAFLIVDPSGTRTTCRTKCRVHCLFIQLNYSCPGLNQQTGVQSPEYGVWTLGRAIHASVSWTIKLKMRLSRTCQSIYSAACVAFVRIIGPRIIYVQFAVR